MHLAIINIKLLCQLFIMDPNPNPCNQFRKGLNSQNGLIAVVW